MYTPLCSRKALTVSMDTMHLSSIELKAHGELIVCGICMCQTQVPLNAKHGRNVIIISKLIKKMHLPFRNS